MATTMDPAVRRQLEMDILSINRDGEIPARAVQPPIGAEPPERDQHDAGTFEPFSRWLLAQKDRGDWIDDLAIAARKDPAFPKSADPDAVRAYLGRRGIVDPDVFEQVDDAERGWLSC